MQEEKNMSDHEELQLTIARIKRMEQYMDEVQKVLRADPDSIHTEALIQEMLQELNQYMDDGKWLQDYDCDERGELPTELKRGVLAQDTLYELLCEIKELEGHTMGL